MIGTKQNSVRQCKLVSHFAKHTLSLELSLDDNCIGAIELASHSVQPPRKSDVAAGCCPSCEEKNRESGCEKSVGLGGARGSTSASTTFKTKLATMRKTTKN
eukprot:774705-Rhodomonas_salina.3